MAIIDFLYEKSKTEDTDIVGFFYTCWSRDTKTIFFLKRIKNLTHLKIGCGKRKKDWRKFLFRKIDALKRNFIG
jgi:hypothetical protein